MGSREDFINFYGDAKYADLYSDYMNNLFPIKVTNITSEWWRKDTEGTYILNSSGNKFFSNNNVNENKNYNFVSDLKQFNFYETFEMTKYDSTDNITIVINFKGNPVRIELEKIEK